MDKKHLDAAITEQAEGMNGLNDVRVARKIITEKFFGAKSKISPEISGRNKRWRGGRSAAAAALRVDGRRYIRGGKKTIEQICSDVGQKTRGRSTQCSVRGMLEATGNHFSCERHVTQRARYAECRLMRYRARCWRRMGATHTG